MLWQGANSGVEPLIQYNKGTYSELFHAFIFHVLLFRTEFGEVKIKKGSTLDRFESWQS